MATNLLNVNPQMQQLAESAVVAAREKFRVSLDFTENSLQELDPLLQQAHEGYKQNTLIDNTVRIWGSYFGEVIRRSFGGDWIVDQKNVFLQIESRMLDPLGQVRSRIVDGPIYNVQDYFHGLKSGAQNNLQEQSALNKCPYCGKENRQDAVICKYCGCAIMSTLRMVPITTSVPLASTPQSEVRPLWNEQHEQIKLTKCPYCAEEIQDAAIVCKHCGRDLVITSYSNNQRKNNVLVTCPDCGKEISPDAEACPHCGKPSAILHCPFCKSTNVMKKSSGQLAAYAFGQMFGAGPFARPAKLYYCNNCKHGF